MYKKLYLTILIIFIFILIIIFKITESPKIVENIEPKNQNEQIIFRNQATTTDVKLFLSNEKTYQGETLIIQIPEKVENIYYNKTIIPYAKINGQQIAFIGFDTREKPGARTIFYSLANGKDEYLDFEIIPKLYPITKIIIPEKLAGQGITSKELINNITENDTISLEKILKEETPFYYFDKPFTSPLENWLEVGGFGNIREDENGGIRHLGVDLDAKIGTPIFASNRGKIAFAGELQSYGKSIVIDHGMKIFSIYLHLSKIEVQNGKIVDRNQKIGETGNSGDYTLEPHLHFSIKIKDISVNPKNFIEMTKTQY